MSANRDMARIVRSWLRTDEHESADRVLDSVLALLDATPQRRSWWPAWRFADMSTFARIAIAAAAVVVLAVVGINLLPRQPGSGGVASPSPTASASPTPTSATSATPAPGPTDVQPPFGALVPGTRYAVTRGDVSLTFTVRVEGWASDGRFWFSAHRGLPEDTLLWFYTDTSTPGVFTDPCAHTGLRQFDRSAAGLAQALAAVPGLELMGGPTRILVYGRSAEFVLVHVPEDLGCVNTSFWLSYDPACGVKLDCTTYPTWLGETIYSWIVDVEGRNFVIQAEVRGPNPSPTYDQELQRVVDSIQFE